MCHAQLSDVEVEAGTHSDLVTSAKWCLKINLKITRILERQKLIVNLRIITFLHSNHMIFKACFNQLVCNSNNSKYSYLPDFSLALGTKIYHLHGSRNKVLQIYF